MPNHIQCGFFHSRSLHLLRSLSNSCSPFKMFPFRFSIWHFIKVFAIFMNESCVGLCCQRILTLEFIKCKALNKWIFVSSWMLFMFEFQTCKMLILNAMRHPWNKYNFPIGWQQKKSSGWHVQIKFPIGKALEWHECVKSGVILLFFFLFAFFFWQIIVVCNEKSDK